MLPLVTCRLAGGQLTYPADSGTAQTNGAGKMQPNRKLRQECTDFRQHFHFKLCKIRKEDIKQNSSNLGRDK